MTLENVAIGLQTDVVEGVRELTETAADGGDNATLLQHSAIDIASGSSGSADLSPEAKYGSVRYREAMDSDNCYTEVLNLPDLVFEFLRCRLDAQGTCRLSDHERVVDRVASPVFWSGTESILNGPPALQNGCSRGEPECPGTRRQGALSLIFGHFRKDTTARELAASAWCVAAERAIAP